MREELCVLWPWTDCDETCSPCPDRARRERIWSAIQAGLYQEKGVEMTILERLVEARLEIVALANAAVMVVAQFGFDVSDSQQAAVTGLVNALLIVGYRLVKGTPAVSAATERTG